jgi:predicted Zn-dependent protease
MRRITHLSEQKMKRLNYLLYVVLLLAFTSLLLFETTSAQNRYYDSKKSKRNYYSNSQRSSSLKSSATEIEYRNNRREKDYSDNYERNTRKDFDSYTRKNINYRKTKNESSENYFHIDKSGNTLWDGKHWEESKFPLNIYVKESSSRYYKSTYKDYVKYAMDVWRKADDRIQYKFVKNIDDADIALIFVENLGDEYEESYLGLTDYDTYDNKEIRFSKIQISLIKNGDEKVSAGEIKATVIHELGHAFGLGHSESEKDLMYLYISPDHTSEMTYDELSIGDKLAIKDAIDLSFEDKYVWK